MPYKTVIRLLVVARNPTNGFPARLLGGFALSNYGKRCRVYRNEGEPDMFLREHIINKLAPQTPPRGPPPDPKPNLTHPKRVPEVCPRAPGKGKLTEACTPS